MLKLLLGRAGTGKTHALLEAIAAQSGRPQVLIVPEQHSHNMERQLCALGGNQVSLHAEVLSFTRLASRVFSVYGGLAAPALDGGGRLLLLCAALKSVAPELKVYQRPSRKPAFLSGLLATVEELKTCCITPEHLWTAGVDAEGPEGDKLTDLSLIYGAYEALTARQGADPRDKLTRLAEVLAREDWAAGKDFYLDGFTDFTPQERQVIGALLARADSVTVALTCDHLEEDEGGAGIFSPARRTARQLLRLAKERGISREIVVRTGRAGPKAPALAHLERELFAPSPAPWTGEGDALTLFTANSPYSEVEWTASEILRLVREEGYRFRDIAVCARSMEGYGSLIETVFARYGIPVFLSRMSDILQKPILALITSALEAAAGGYRYDDVFRYLKTGLTALSAEDVDLLENYVLKWNLEGSAWTAKRDWANHPKGYGRTFTEEDNALLSRLNALRKQVAAPLEALRKNPDRTGRGQAVALYSFLEAAGVPERLAERTAELNRRGQAALAEEYAQLWDILCGGLEQCAQILGDAPMELDEFSRLFALVLSQYDVGSIPVSLDRVSAGEMPRLAHRSCPVVFLLGADDGAIPAAAPSPGLLNDDDRSLLASYGLELAPRLSDKLYREMTIVYETCALPQKRFCVSWAAAGADGEEKWPSFLLSKLKVLFPHARRVEEGRLDGSFRLAAPLPALELAGRFPRAGTALKTLPDYAPLVERMERAAGLTRGHLTRPAVDALYGRRVPMSASRMDKYKSCHFSYFMQYGLKAEARKAAGFQAPEYGTFVHYVLEHVLRACQARGGVKEVSREELRALAREAVERYVAEELGGLEHETARFQYLFRRLLKSVFAVVDNVAEELRASQFQPISFELGFGAGKDLPPVELTVDGVTVSISGFVDRVDGWEHDGKLYLRVVDYKTGRKSFDLTDIWNGMGLQMLLYLFTLADEGEALYGKQIEPAGVLYLPAREAVVAGSRAMTEEERRKKVDAELRRRGIVLDDPEVLSAMEELGEGGPRFLPVRVNRAGAITGEALVSAERLGKLARHTGRILEEIGQELAAGNIAADPFWRGPEHNACQWCDYAEACHFEEGHGGDCRRWLPSVTGEEFWQAVAREQESG
ncbi:MAG TPA: exodeoxyribonuclease V subunit gamma [Candidatus Flavonifractor avistercoris]|nr:exodeoxyribonuclease V subunit gamma [Candidatus Flavonifractor avistercoris]